MNKPSKYEIKVTTLKIGRCGRAVYYITNGLTKLRPFYNKIEAQTFINKYLNGTTTNTT